MIKSSDFYTELNKFNDLLVEHEFARVSDGVYKNDLMRLEFILNKWGWDDDNGWGFMIRAIDPRYEDEVGIFDWSGALDITPSNISIDLKDLYKGQPTGLLKTLENDQYIPFYTLENLNSVLKIVMPVVLKQLSEWGKKQKNTNFNGTRQKIDAEDQASVKQELDDLFGTKS